MNNKDSIENKLETLKEAIRALKSEETILEAQLKVRDTKYKTIASVPLSTLETMAGEFQQKFDLYLERIKTIQSYSGPSPDNGKEEAVLKGKLEVLQDVVVLLGVLISRTLREYKESL